MFTDFRWGLFKTLSFILGLQRCLWTTPPSKLQCLVLEGCCWKLSAPAWPKKLVVIAAAWGLQCQWLSNFRAATAAKAHAPNRDRPEQPERLRLPFQLWWRKRHNGQCQRGSVEKVTDSDLFAREISTLWQGCNCFAGLTREGNMKKQAPGFQAFTQFNVKFVLVRNWVHL